MHRCISVFLHCASLSLAGKKKEHQEIVGKNEYWKRDFLVSAAIEYQPAFHGIDCCSKSFATFDWNFIWFFHVAMVLQRTRSTGVTNCYITGGSLHWVKKRVKGRKKDDRSWRVTEIRGQTTSLLQKKDICWPLVKSLYWYHRSIMNIERGTSLSQLRLSTNLLSMVLTAVRNPLQLLIETLFDFSMLPWCYKGLGRPG